MKKIFGWLRVIIFSIVLGVSSGDMSAFADSLKDLIARGEVAPVVARLKADGAKISGEEKLQGLLDTVDVGQSDMFEALVKAGASVSEVVYDKICGTGHFHLLTTLQKHGGVVEGMKPRVLLCAAEKQATEGLPAIMGKTVFDREVASRALLVAVKAQADLGYILSLNPDLSWRDPEGLTAADYAIRLGDPELAKRLTPVTTPKK